MERVQHDAGVHDHLGYRLPYRYNPELFRYEYWDHLFSFAWRRAVALPDYSSICVLTFDDTWAEPLEE